MWFEEHTCCKPRICWRTSTVLSWYAFGGTGKKQKQNEQFLLSQTQGRIFWVSRWMDVQNGFGRICTCILQRLQRTGCIFLRCGLTGAAWHFNMLLLNWCPLFRGDIAGAAVHYLTRVFFDQLQIVNLKDTKRLFASCDKSETFVLPQLFTEGFYPEWMSEQSQMWSDDHAKNIAERAYILFSSQIIVPTCTWCLTFKCLFMSDRLPNK